MRFDSRSMFSALGSLRVTSPARHHTSCMAHVAHRAMQKRSIRISTRQPAQPRYSPFIRRTANPTQLLIGPPEATEPSVACCAEASKFLSPPSAALRLRSPLPDVVLAPLSIPSHPLCGYIRGSWLGESALSSLRLLAHTSSAFSPSLYHHWGLRIF